MSDYSNLINYSRAGDLFHYRWAAKRCLQLLDFDTDLKYMTIEGSLEPTKGGECIIDVAEYYETTTSIKSVNYFQLKHTTVQSNKNFTLGLLKDTIHGFSERFKDLDKSFTNVNFTIVTNRPISKGFKDNIEKLCKHEIVSERFKSTIESYTGLKDTSLQKFCSKLVLCDSEGNYDAQKYGIHKELALITSTINIPDLILRLIEKITEKIEPDKENIVTIDDVLEVFNITDIGELFPAPPLFEPITNFIIRNQQEEIVESIINCNTQSIITANGGVGKSILCSHLHDAFGASSVVVTYDCFGNGSYRRASQSRHTVVDAFTQITNQLAKEGLCRQLIPQKIEPDSIMIKIFLRRLSEASSFLKARCSKALLIIIFDAADNAEMAAADMNETCFARQLLRERVPDNCRIVYTCRPERIHLLEPSSSINIIMLNPFTTEETSINLLNYYPSATDIEIIEFGRLTSYNPRVQANVISLNYDTIDELLRSFNSCSLSVDDVIDKQLTDTIHKTLDTYPENQKSQIIMICVGLATLPPFVPIKILSHIANVEEDTIKSFICELGRPLWMIGDSVQFRDEPTEKWFQDKFIADTNDLKSFIRIIKPLAEESSYVSEVLPILMFKAKQLNELIDLALSDSFLPSDSIYDSRKIKLFRLQYAFKAALKQERFLDSCKLALRAGEEIAGYERRIETLKNNCDLTSSFLSLETIEEMAHKKLFSSSWEGSQTIYTASLLSSQKELHGEANAYLRSAKHWLRNHYDRIKEESKDDFLRNDVSDLDILEFVNTIYNLMGVNDAVLFILSWEPNRVIFDLTTNFIGRLLDKNHFEEVLQISELGINEPIFILALTSEMMTYGKYPSKKCLIRCLNKINNSKTRLSKPDELINRSYSKNAFLSFLEACVINNLPEIKIIKALDYYISTPRLHSIAERHQYINERSAFLRSVSIRSALRNTYPTTVNDIIPKEWKDEKFIQKNQNDIESAKRYLSKLLPWYIIYSKILAGHSLDLDNENLRAFKSINNGDYSYYDPYDNTPYEVTRIRFRNIIHSSRTFYDINNFLEDFRNDKLKTNFNDLLHILRVSCRLEKLEILIDDVQVACDLIINNLDIEESTEEYCDQYIRLSRAVLAFNYRDSKHYFNKAIEVAFNFGTEIVARWNAVVDIAKRISDSSPKNEIAFKFMRCAEFVGKTVSREKYWDRNESVRTCFHLSPESAFAIVNRWKERNEGWSNRQIVALADSALKSDLITPSSVYSLSAFSWEYDLFEFYEDCINKEKDKEKQQVIFNKLIQDFRINNRKGKVWESIQKLAFNNGLYHDELKNVDVLVKSYNEENNEYTQGYNYDDQLPSWSESFSEYNFLEPSSVEALFNNPDKIRNAKWFWSGLYKTLGSNKIFDFLDILYSIENIDSYDIKNALKYFPEKLKSKISVQASWNKFLEIISQRFPHHFISHYERYDSDYFKINNESANSITKGVIKGFCESVDLESAEALFRFTSYFTSILTSESSFELLNFSLSHFDNFLDDNFADGPWSEDVNPQIGIDEAFSKFIYANLGSPIGDERWRAVHTVIRLYEANNYKYILLLVKQLDYENITAFIPPNYTFYTMHARLYLLIALLRSSLNKTTILLETKDTFLNIALSTDKHILISKYAGDIVKAIEKDNPGSYDTQKLKELEFLSKSKFSPIIDSSYDSITSSPWHIDKIIKPNKDIYFDYDFEDYWFGSLGRIFGVPSKEIQDLVADVILNDWNIVIEGKYIDDSRKELWKDGRYGYETDHRHGSYPQNDRYTFYLTYHAVLTVAGKLLDCMAVVNNPEYNEDRWSEWLQSHMLLEDNNFLNCDFRDMFPLDTRNWLTLPMSKNWLWEIKKDDFLDVLLQNIQNKAWINIEGKWNNYRDGRNEEISVSSILIPKRLSNSLLYAIENSNYNHKEVYLSWYCEGNPNYESNHCFYGIDWIYQDSDRDVIGKHDPYSGDIDARPYLFRDEIRNKLCLHPSILYKNWYNKADILCSKNEIWSDEKPSSREQYYHVGNRLMVSSDFLKEVCKIMNVEVAIQVSIRRDIVGYHRRSEDGERYLPKSSKTYMFCKEGEFRDTKQSHRIS